MLNEADTKAKLIDPKLKKSGWSEEHITREYRVSDGKIEVIGTEHRRAPYKWADYVLRTSTNGQALAVIEAKPEDDPVLSGIPQAKDYARKLGVYFAFSSNGHEIEEFDFSTHKQASLENFPNPEELLQRYLKIEKTKVNKSDEIIRKVSLTPYYSAPGSFTLRYYQEGAIQAATNAMLSGQKRILLNLATGTGKTAIAFNVAWKLVKSGYLRRVLFLADRNFLRNQAYNEAFAPFGDARQFIEEGKAPKTRDVYFSIYQAMYSAKDGKRVYQHYPQDFFDLIIIDECHRSGYGTWHEILKHFGDAVHLGMTATPKRTDNIDTYEYFGDPVYQYSFREGIDDGYLSPFLVNRVLTNIDQEGKLILEEARSQGAEIIYSAEEEPKDIYESKEFEKTITLPDRTEAIAKHLTKLLRNFDPLAKTMVFCVSMDHADEMAKVLQNEFADLGFDNFAVSIVSRNGDIKETEYERFKDSDKRTPVIATTVDLLTTGVDVPSVKNIVIVKPIASKVVFKQIIGRGSRIDQITDKHFFRIIDYVKATRLFDDWEQEPPPPEPGPQVANDGFLSGKVLETETEAPIVGATVTIQLGPNKQEYQRTDSEGKFFFSRLPRKKLKLFVSATDYKKRKLSVEPFDNPKEFIVIELSKRGKGPKIVKVTGLPVHIVEEDTVVLEKDGRTLKVQDYIRYSKKAVVKFAASQKDLKEIWVDQEKREKFLEDLRTQSIYPEILAQILNKPEIDTLDLIASVAFDTIPLTRDERVEAFHNLQQEFVSKFSQDAREVIFALLEKYRLAGIDEAVNPKVFELPPFDEMGYVSGVAQRFGSIEKLRVAINNFQEKIYVGGP